MLSLFFFLFYDRITQFLLIIVPLFDFFFWLHFYLVLINLLSSFWKQYFLNLIGQILKCLPWQCVNLSFITVAHLNSQIFTKLYVTGFSSKFIPKLKTAWMLSENKLFWSTEWENVCKIGYQLMISPFTISACYFIK